ncbi:MAG: diacylglycerol kinase (ATP) [Nonlabens sp.]|jgi:diacylglycerol kinase (ATP)
MGLEAMNTAAEAIADFIHPDFHEKIGRIKDIAAGAVLITAFAAAVIGLIIYIPYINALFS